MTAALKSARKRTAFVIAQLLLPSHVHMQALGSAASEKQMTRTRNSVSPQLDCFAAFDAFALQDTHTQTTHRHTQTALRALISSIDGGLNEEKRSNHEMMKRQVC